MAQEMIGFSLWHLIWQSDAVSMMVLVLLFGLSIINWAVFITKLIMLCYHTKQCKKAMNYLHNITQLEQLPGLVQMFEGTVAGLMLSRYSTIIPQNIDMIRLQTEAVIEEVIEEEQRWVPLFSTSAAVAPLLGLFGTVWGLVHSFMNIAQTQSADIITVAPGIAEALVTTLAGLLVAIPSLIMANVLQVKLRALEHCLMIVSDRLIRVSSR